MAILIIGGAYQNKNEVARRYYPDLARVEDLHVRVRETLAAGEDPMALLDGLRGKVTVCDEVGCGIVPLRREDEAWREAVGRLCCALAEEADAVIRVLAGVPQAIKGELPCL